MLTDVNDQWQCSIAFVNRKQNNQQELEEKNNDLIFKGRVPPFWNNSFHVFYNRKTITMFSCAPFFDIQALKHEFLNKYFPVIVNDLHLYFVFRPYY